MRLAILVAVLCGVQALPMAATARVIFITGAETTGSGAAMNGADATFPSLVQALNSGEIVGGDTVYLAGVAHGGLLIRGQNFDTTVTITSVPGKRAHLDFVSIVESSNIVLSNLDVWPLGQGDGSGALVRAVESTHDITLDGIAVKSVAKAADYPKWTKSTWTRNKRIGIMLQGPNSTVRNSVMTGLFNGVILSGDNALIEGNVVSGFTGDGMRSLGDNSIVRGNRVENCYKISEAHNDAFQAWSTDAEGNITSGVLTGLTIENNMLSEWTLPVSSALRCSLQGIFIGGFLDRLTIRNNVIAVTAWHGIGIYGGENIMIQHNTVANPSGSTDRKPWIAVQPGRDGRQSRNVVIVNNIATAVKWDKKGTLGVTVKGNVTLTNSANEFVAVRSGNLRLGLLAKGLDSGVAGFPEPATDIEGKPRVRGTAPDAGAYERQ